MLQLQGVYNLQGQQLACLLLGPGVPSPVGVFDTTMYMTTSPASVPSERLFSTAGCTLSGANNMERLVILKTNTTYF